jgi:GT2 family glycosyltransferase
LFLNPDTELVTPAINIMFEHIQRLSNVGAIGCKLLNADGSIQTSCIQAFPTILNQLFGTAFLRYWFPKASLWGTAPLFCKDNEPAQVDALSGACMMLSRKMFEQIGHFSEDYFMYAEDLDLCYKIRQSGYANYYVPGASVIHVGGVSTDNRADTFQAIMMRESILQFMNKTRGRLYGCMYRFAMLISAIGRLAALMCMSPLLLQARRRNSMYGSFRKWRAVLAWSVAPRKHL